MNMVKTGLLNINVWMGIKAFFLSLFFGSNAQAKSVEPLKVLFIGNSYTHMNEMPKIFQKMADEAGKNVIVERNTQSGASFKVHSERSDMYVAIKKRKWDYIVLQGYSRELSHSVETIDTASIPYIQKITDSIYANNPCTNVLFYMTWGYENGYLEREEVNTYEKMAERIEAGYRYLGRRFDVPVVPVGMVWKEVKESSNIDLYAPDRAHPSKKGSYLIASTFYNALFGESNERVYTSTINGEDANIIKQAAAKVVTTNRDKYKLDQNRFWLMSNVTKEGQYQLKVASLFPKANKVTWYFGDGKKLRDFNGTHYYRKHGKYKVRLKVYDACGIREHERIVEFKKPPRIKGRRRRKLKVS